MLQDGDEVACAYLLACLCPACVHKPREREIALVHSASLAYEAYKQTRMRPIIHLARPAFSAISLIWLQWELAWLAALL